MFINDEHNNDNSAIGTLIAALFTGEIKAASLFMPSIDLHAPSRSTKRPTGSRKPRAHKESSPLRALDGGDDGWEDDVPDMESLKRTVQRAFIHELGRTTTVRDFLDGRHALAFVIGPAPTKMRHKQIYNVGDSIAEYYDLEAGLNLNLATYKNLTFDQLCLRILMLIEKLYKKNTKAKTSRDVCLDCDKNECECSDVLERPKKKAVKIKKEAKPVKIKTYDNSHNWGLAGRIAQRSIDADSKTKTKTPMPECAGCGSSSCTDPDCGL